MASLLEEWVRPRLLVMRRAALRVWHVTLNSWVINEEALHGYHTERLERLIDQAWDAYRKTIEAWDPRFTLQSLRSLPPEVIDLIAQLASDSIALAGVVRVATAAAASSRGAQWHRGENEVRNWVALDSEHLTILADQAPDVLGSCLGAARLVYEAQGWYRWAGKGKRLQRMPVRMTSDDLSTIEQWDGTGLLLMNAPVLNEDPVIEKSVAIYETRRDAVKSGGRQSGLLGYDGNLDQGSVARMWYVSRRAMQAFLPVHVPALDLTFPAPAWYPIPDFDLVQWIEQLRPFDDALQSRLGLNCDELLIGLKALGLVIERQTQCGYLKVGEWAGTDAVLLESPAEASCLRSAVAHLASVLVRGTLRASVDGFITALSDELERFRWPQPRQLAETFLNALRGLPDPHGLPTAILFYVLDPLTCVLDLSLWHGFTDACLAVATSGDGDVGTHRGYLFEAQVRDHLIANLRLDQSDIPWPANLDVWDEHKNLGDVDFCFVSDGILFNLDMKSWQHSSDYFAGHYHTIRNRMSTLKVQIEHLEHRGIALERQLERKGLRFVDRLDFLVVAFPEYLAFNERSLWYGDQPRVITASELVLLASRPAELRRFSARQV